MKKITPLDFTKQTPKMLIGRKKHSPLYVRAYLEPGTKPDGEFERNTSAWD